MITLYFEEKQRNKGDILYGATTDIQENIIYRVESLTPGSEDLKGLGEPNSFFLMDQTPLTNAAAAMIAYQQNSTVLLYNKPHKTLEETLSFYEHISITSGAVIAIGPEAAAHLRSFNTNGHIECALEEIDYITYPGSYSSDTHEAEPIIYADGKVADYFRNYCLRRWDKEDEKDGLFLPPFSFTRNFDGDANTYLSFKPQTRERMRMLDNRFRNVYVPYCDEYTVLDPRSFFKANIEQVASVVEGRTEHESAALLKALFEAMYDYIIEVFVPEPVVKTKKIPGNFDLFEAIAYNLSRDV